MVESINNNNEWDGQNRRILRMESESTTWERHGQSILAALILAGIMYIAGQSINANTQIEIINVKLNVMTEQLKETGKDRYTATKALNDFAVRDSHATRTDLAVSKLNDLYIALEQRVDKVERQVELKHGDG